MPRIRPGLRIAGAIVTVSMAVAGGARLTRYAEPIEARQARQAISAGRYDDADQALDRWLMAVPDAIEAHLLKGRAAVATNRLTEAAEELRRAQSLDRTSEDLALLRALLLSKMGRHGEAEPILSRAFAGDRAPDRQVDEALAKVYLETFNLARASVVLDRWARDFPDDPKPPLWLAEVHSRSGAGAKSVMEDYREALRRDPSLDRARLGLAEELRKAYRNAEAAIEYEAYLGSRPDDAAAHLGLGQNLMEQGDEAAAIRHLKTSITLDPRNPEPHKVIAEASVRRGDWSTALGLLDLALALDPADLTTRFRRGLALKRLGRDDEAEAEQAVARHLRDDLDRLGRAMARLIKSPHDRESQLIIARWMFNHAREQEGARWAGQILKERPNDPEASGLLADFHQRRGEMGLANFYRLQAPSGFPSSPSGNAK
jgi:tetratricopeptide (TPR) repeat protein